jgi:hypothetical protein
MKIVQCLKSGEIQIQLENNEKYDIEEHLHGLTDLLASQAIKLHELTNSFKQLVKRLEVLEKKSEPVNNKN